ncbi:2-hydroxycarboxylate transporter family protein [Enterocloster lavalensis]|uniref:2-hydroxycarboxylate transporter family protein n=1 Tax=Enterocloster lavalensis TaxID=460384 RepID=UPI0023F269FB|nr:2-hydroxycarboxylate transporter family protein [Enterocloster lavalensis]
MEKLFQALDGHSFWGYKLFAIPMYLFLLLAFTVITANQLDLIPSSMVGSIGAMFIIGIVMGELGDRLPVWKDYIGGGTLLALLGGSLLVYFNLLGESCRESIGELMKTTDFITFYAAVLITGSILSIDRAVLLKSFLGYIPTVLAGLAGAAALGSLGGLLFGKSVREVLLYYFLPIMGPGTGAGAVPMSQIYESAGMGPAAEFLSTAVPILTLGLVMSIVLGAVVNKIGLVFPKLSGEGRLSRREHQETVTEVGIENVTPRSCASGFVLATGYYIMGVILSKIIPPVMGVSIHAFAYMVILLAVSNMLGLIPQSVKDGSRKLQSFFAGQLSWVIMVGVGVVYVSIADVLAVLTISNFIMVFFVILGAMAGAALMGWLMGFFPVEAVITAALCMSNSGGAGDVAVLGAAQRMNLLSWAQISSRIGGGVMLIIASILMSAFAG